jgi:hypothetical protein
MPSAVFKLAIPATKRPQTYALDCAATRIGEDVLNELFSTNATLLKRKTASTTIKATYKFMSQKETHK